LRKHQLLLRDLQQPQHRAPSLSPSYQDIQAAGALAKLIETTDFYEEKIAEAHARTAKETLRAVAKEIEQNGLRVGFDKSISADDPGYAD
jgi:hypothetical protein